MENIPTNNAITIHDSDQVEVLRIETGGRIFWRPQGSIEMREVDMDKDLSVAFALCVEMLSGLPHKSVMEQVRADGIRGKAGEIAKQVAQYMVDVKLITEEHVSIHEKNVTTLINRMVPNKINKHGREKNQ